VVAYVAIAAVQGSSFAQNFSSPERDRGLPLARLVRRPAGAHTHGDSNGVQAMNSLLCALAIAFIAAGVDPATAQVNEAPVATDPGNTVTIQPGQAPAAESGDDILCQIVPPTTGTRLGGGRECHKRREWVQRQHDAEAITRAHERIGYIWAPKGVGH
jgi:hypothetical protein